MRATTPTGKFGDGIGKHVTPNLSPMVSGDWTRDYISRILAWGIETEDKLCHG